MTNQREANGLGHSKTSAGGSLDEEKREGGVPHTPELNREGKTVKDTLMSEEKKPSK